MSEAEQFHPFLSLCPYKRAHFGPNEMSRPTANTVPVQTITLACARGALPSLSVLAHAHTYENTHGNELACSAEGAFGALKLQQRPDAWAQNLAAKDRPSSRSTPMGKSATIHEWHEGADGNACVSVLPPRGWSAAACTSDALLPAAVLRNGEV
ncbi:hypothetical protein MRX96_034782 [Rhipicephalus microplus]